MFFGFFMQNFFRLHFKILFKTIVIDFKNFAALAQHKGLLTKSTIPQYAMKS
jgi:hypothetical protein